MNDFLSPSRVVLAMSGGVDSSVAASLLCRQGFEVIGVFMRHGEESPVACGPGLLPILPAGERLDHKQGCCSAADADDARRVADRLGIPFYALNLRAEFGRIIDYFVDEYSRGRTPNPCVMCNNWLKFGKLFDYADSVGARYVATGHYARLASPLGRCEIGARHRDGDQGKHNDVALYRGLDAQKDQSYVLFGVEPDRLQRMLLPIGGYRKSEIRELAREFGLRVAHKPDSQEICFVTGGKHAEFVAERRRGGETRGEIITTEGNVVGQHDGIEAFTIGQRKGLGVAMGEPYFVVRIDPQSRRVVIGKKEALACWRLTADRLNWLADLPRTPFQCLAQIRYNSPAQSATAHLDPEGCLQVRFDQACYGVAPGQAVVLYDEDRVLGGGWIRAADAG